MHILVFVQWQSTFSSTCAKSIDFIIGVGQIIGTEEVGTLFIPLSGGTIVKIHNVALAPDCDSNLILLGQLQESGITYHDNSTLMILMRNGKVIAKAKRKWNVFIPNLAIPNQAMSAKVMAIRGKCHPTHLVSKNKQIWLWHRRLIHLSNARVVKTSKLINSINIDLKEYDSAKVFIEEYDPSGIVIDSDDSEISSNKNKSPADIALRLRGAAFPNTNFTHQTRGNDNGISKLCASCVDNKSTQVVRRNKSMTLTIDKLGKVHVDLWGLHNLPSKSGSIYATILICKYIQKTWMLYLRGNDDFVDAFQSWLPRVEVESGYSMKTL